MKRKLAKQWSQLFAVLLTSDPNTLMAWDNNMHLICSWIAIWMGQLCSSGLRLGQLNKDWNIHFQDGLLRWLAGWCAVSWGLSWGCWIGALISFHRSLSLGCWRFHSMTTAFQQSGDPDRQWKLPVLWEFPLETEMVSFSLHFIGQSSYRAHPPSAIDHTSSWEERQRIYGCL